MEREGDGIIYSLPLGNRVCGERVSDLVEAREAERERERENEKVNETRYKCVGESKKIK